jgi:hypothetical protein
MQRQNETFGNIESESRIIDLSLSLSLDSCFAGVTLEIGRHNQLLRKVWFAFPTYTNRVTTYDP